MGKNEMSRRERIMAAIRGQEVDRLPWSPCLDDYFLGKAMDQISAFRRLRADAMIRHALNYIGSVPLRVTAAPPGKTLPFNLRTIKVGDEMETAWETPVGTITERYRYNQESPNIPWVTKNKVQTLPDLKILQWLCEKAEFAPVPVLFEIPDKQVGDDGIVTVSVLGTPLFWAINSEAGVETFWYLFHDYPAEVEEYMEVAHQMVLRMITAAAEGPGEVIIQYENLSSTLCSPKIWEKFCFPRVNEYADVVHATGKIFLQHNCGHLSAFGTKIGETRLDGCVDVATPPTGNMSFSLARKLWGPDKLVMGGIDATHYAYDTPEQIKEYVRGMIRDMGDGKRMILGSGDATPKNAAWENLFAVSELIEQEAAFPLSI